MHQVAVSSRHPSTRVPRSTRRVPRGALAVVTLMLLAMGGLRAAAQEQIYTWTDDRGVVHFSNSGPPQGTSATPMFSIKEFRPVPLEVDANSPARKLVRVELQGTTQRTEVRMLVDTGADKTVITPTVADQIGVSYRRDQVLKGVTGEGVGALVELPRLRVGSMELRDFEVIVGPADAPNLLGMDVLNALDLSVGRDTLYRSRQ